MSLTSIPAQPICLFGRREIPVKTPCQGCEVSVRRHVGFTSSSHVFHVFLTDQEEEVKQLKPLLLLTSSPLVLLVSRPHSGLLGSVCPPVR